MCAVCWYQCCASTPYFHFWTVYTVRYGPKLYLRSKENYGPNRSSTDDRILPFCREKRGPGFSSGSEPHLLFYPNFFVLLFIRAFQSYIGDMSITAFVLCTYELKWPFSAKKANFQPFAPYRSPYHILPYTVLAQHWLIWLCAFVVHVHMRLRVDMHLGLCICAFKRVC
jgi:hypothetical protein